MADKPLTEYDFYKDIIQQKKHSGCAACRQEGYMLEAQVMDMMRERMARTANDDKDRNGVGNGGVSSTERDTQRTEERDTSIVDPILQRHTPDK